MKFHWVKFEFQFSNKFLPAFVFPPGFDGEKRELAQYITQKGELSDKKFTIEKKEISVSDNLKNKKYVLPLRKFNAKNSCNYE